MKLCLAVLFIGPFATHALDCTPLQNEEPGCGDANGIYQQSECGTDIVDAACPALCSVCTRPDCDSTQVDQPECGRKGIYQASECGAAGGTVLAACPSLCGACVGPNYPPILNAAKKGKKGKKTKSSKVGKSKKGSKSSPQSRLLHSHDSKKGKKSGVSSSKVGESKKSNKGSEARKAANLTVMKSNAIDTVNEVAEGLAFVGALGFIFVLFAWASNPKTPNESIPYFVDETSPVFLSPKEALGASPAVLALSRLDPEESVSILM